MQSYVATIGLSKISNKKAKILRKCFFVIPSNHLKICQASSHWKSVMEKFLIIMAFALFLVHCDDAPRSGSIVQVSKGKSDSNLKAKLITCMNEKQNSEHGVKCKPRVEIQAWLESKDHHKVFLLIDEVYDTKKRAKFSLLHPYLIEVSMSEHTLMYPLVLNQVVDVTCKQQEMLHRRQTDNQNGMNLGMILFFFKSSFA